MAKMEKSGAATAELPSQRYSKEQLMTSKKYANRRDLLGALLAEDKGYLMNEVDMMLKSYDERKM